MSGGEFVQCTKCSDVHPESDRPRRSDEEFEKKSCTPLVCPKCGHDAWQPVGGATAESHEQSDIQSA